MTTSSSIHSVVSYGNGATFTHAFNNLEVFSKSELLVLLFSAGVITQLAEGTGQTNYAITFNNPIVDGKTDGFLTYPATEITPLTSAQFLLIVRVPPQTQTAPFKNIGVLLPRTLETVLDKLQAQILYLQEQIDRCPKMPRGLDTSTFDLTLPAPNASRGIKWNAGADAFEEVLL